MRNYCTLFDSNYLPRGLVMYRSLEACGEDFTLYVVCFDNLAYEILCRLNLCRMVPILLESFESPQLLAVKGDRSAAEYCWTCTSHVIHYVLDTYRLPDVTYLDADLCFYERPSLLFEEFEQAGASVLITSHRYTPRHDQSKKSGIYCVQFMTFKADERGLAALQWWQDRCLEWCYARFEDGKFGDQKYLDDWPERFEGVHVLQHSGGGVAPWNLEQYRLSKRANRLYMDEWPLVFYHVHGYKYYLDGVHNFSTNPYYRLSREVVDWIYRPYAQSLLKAYAEIHTIDPDFSRGWANRERSLRATARYLKRLLLGVVNEYRIV